MKTKLLLGGILLIAATLVRAATNDLSSALQKGLFEEEANRNLDAAIQAYQSVAARFDKDRQLAATAIFRLGECYRKLGKTNEANVQYERILRDFSDQTDLVKLSRNNVQRPQSGPEAFTEALRRNVQQNAAQTEAASMQAQIEELKRLTPEKRRIAIQQNYPNPYLTTLMQDLSRAEQNLAGLQKDYGPESSEVQKARAVLDTINNQINAQLEGVMQGLELKMKAALQAAKTEQASSEKNASGGGSDALATTDDEEKEIRRIQAMIQNSPDLINAPSGDPNLTPLCRAARMAQSRVAEFLLSNGADVNLNRPLSYAAGDGHKAMVELLLRRGAAVNAVDGAGQTALHRAAERGFLSVAEALLAAKADPNLRDETARTSLTLAVENGSRPVAAALLAHGVDPNIVSRTRKNWGRDRTTEGAPLHFAVVRGDAAMVSLLLTNRADLTLRNSFGESPLDLAAILGKTAIAAQLLAAGAEANGSEPATGASTPLHHAASGGHRDVAKLLLEHGANPNATAVRGQAEVTPLMIAAGNGDAEIVSLLLMHKANPNLLDAQGNTALWNAINSRKVDVIRLLLANGANPDQLRADGYAPLVIAIGNLQDKAIVAALLDAKADPNAKDKSGMTPLHHAVQIGRKEFVELLLARGADPNIRNNQGQTPLDILKPKSGELAELLRQHGALDELPDFSSVRVTRAGVPQQIVFRKDANGINGFTVLEAVRNFYPQPVNSQKFVGGSLVSYQQNPTALSFPDFSRITIVRRTGTKAGEQKEIQVNVLGGTNGFDRTKDVSLEFGDLVEIREREHALSETAVGLTHNQDQQLLECLSRQVIFVIKGQPNEVAIQGRSEAAYLSSALQQDTVRRILRSSSDLSRIKVKRTNPATNETKEFVVNAQEFLDGKKPRQDDLWLRDGDVIEVPDKP
ncbi:MAG: ankyrin repeat domain-containing protein [Verrucomicrobia bacterium]|nr:ankyrin repeat domain-containing protein [Verrucomicrobiota bacterium]